MIYPLTTLEAIFRREDIEGLIGHGAPHDEYDSEAAELQTELEKLEEGELTFARLSSIVMEIWQDSFGPFSEDDLRKRQPVLHHFVQLLLEQRPTTGKPVGAQQLPFDNRFPSRRDGS